MKVLEFYFNPKEKENFIFDSFCYVPENIYEKRMGGLFMAGELENALPHNFRLLEKISAGIKKEFYSKFQRTHEQSLKESLKRANELLSLEVSRENTDWLGNLNFSIISLKNFDLNFTKTGNIKMFLIRGPHIIDIGEKLDSEEIEPYPLKIFNNIVSGKVGENDIILAVTKGIFPLLKGTISDLTKQSIFDEKAFRDSLNAKKAELANFSGTLVLINVTKIPTGAKRSKIIFQREIEKFSLKNNLLLFAKSARKKTNSLPSLKNRLIKLGQSIKSGPKIQFSIHLPKLPKLPKFPKPKNENGLHEKMEENLPEIKKSDSASIKIKVKVKTKSEEKIPLSPIRFPNLKKIEFPKITQRKFIPVLLLAAVLLIGFFIFQRQEGEKAKEYKNTLQEIREKTAEAEGLMAIKDINQDAKKTATKIFSKAWDEILPITRADSSVKNDAVSLKNIIENNLEILNNLVKIEKPETIFEFDSDEFIPQRIISTNGNLYLFSPYAQNIFEINKDAKGNLFQTKQKFSSAVSLPDGEISFFSKPDQIIGFKNGELKEAIYLKRPYSEFNFNNFAHFKGNLYFIDGSAGEITKYSDPISEGKDSPQEWLNKNAENPENAKSIAVDGFVWILNNENRILKYHSGNLQKTITPDIFPKPVNFSSIKISPVLPYIFILEPAQNRIIILDKEGKIIKQFQSEKFDNLLDFAVSEDGKAIWLLNGLKVYKINL